MNIGKLDRRIELEQNTATQDTFGQAIDQWESLGKRWASVAYKGGGEQIQADEQVAVQRVEFTIRHEEGLTARLRVRYQGQVYDIEAVAEIGRRAGLKLTAFTRNDDGR